MKPLIAFLLLPAVTAIRTAHAADFVIVPKPMKAQRAQGFFSITPRTQIYADAKLVKDMAEWVKPLVAGLIDREPQSLVLPMPAREPQKGSIIFSIDAKAEGDLGTEGYRLSIGPNVLRASAANPAGLFYAVQSIRQILASGRIPTGEIVDRPRFAWRGLLLDVGRHYQPISFIKRFIDSMAMFKLNILHWHLTEDQGWRIEIKKYPKLTEIGAWREETKGRGDVGDGFRHGGFYTQAQIRDIVAYAAKRHVTIVPEIEMPGHALAALAAYPNLSCTGGPFSVGQKWGVYPDIYCAGNPDVYRFLEDVLSEALALFPSKFIHIGGDEAPKDRWKACSKCQAAIRQKGLKDEHELQSSFVRHFDAFLAKRGRRLIGWDEILEGGLAPGATVMSWRGISGGIAAAKEGHDVVMTPTDYCYLDYYQSKALGEPEAIGGFVPIERVYAFDPVAKEISDPRRVLGVQGNLWAEYLPHPEQVEYMAYPRAMAIAEVGWTPQADRNFEDFADRISRLQPEILALCGNRREDRKLPTIVGLGVQASFGFSKSHPIECLFDRNPNTRCLSDRAPRAGETLTVSLSDPRSIRSISIESAPNRYAIREAVLEYAPPGGEFVECGKVLRGSAKVSLKGKVVAHVRIRFLGKEIDPIELREIKID